MAYPNSGFIKIFPDTVTITSGQFSLNSDAVPQAARPVADLQAFYDLRTAVLANAPCMTRDTEKPAASANYVPAGGTYRLNFSTSYRGIEFYDGSYPSAVVATHDFSSAFFPTPMAITSPALWWNGQAYFGPSRDRNVTKIDFYYDDNIINTYTPPSAGLLTGAQNSGSTSIISNPFVVWSTLNLMTKSFGFSMPCDIITSVLLNTPRAAISECFILAVYNTGTIQWATTTPNALPGEIVEVSSPSSQLGIFNLDEFKIYWDTRADFGEVDVNPLFPGFTGGIRIPRNYVLEFTTNLFRFILPPGYGIPYGGRRLMLTGTSTSVSFVGEFPLQNFNVELVDGSGLYVLTDDKHNDTYYDRSVSPVVTTDLKIPDPSVKTGYFNA